MSKLQSASFKMLLLTTLVCVFAMAPQTVVSQISADSSTPVPSPPTSSPTVLPTRYMTLILRSINNERRTLSTPLGVAGNSHRVEWNEDLALLAQAHTDQCSLRKKPHLEISAGCHYVGQLYNVAPVDDFDQPILYLRWVFRYWIERGNYYDYTHNICTDFVDCRPYTQLIWADTNKVGCGLSTCELTDTYFLLCFFSPGGNVFGVRPYIATERHCALCETVFEECHISDNLCVCIDESSCGCPDPFRDASESVFDVISRDPHFRLRLPSGQLLCYDVQGEAGSIFNLISSDDLEINALFIPHKRHPKTWLGVIGVSMNGRKLIFNVTSETIQLDSMKMDAHTVERIRLTSGKFYLTMTTGKTRDYHVEVDLAEYDVRFMIVFAHRQHLNLIWISGGIEKKRDFHGLLGQFLRPGVKLDENLGLFLPGRDRPQVMRQRNQFGFQDIPKLYDTTERCWTTRRPSEQGAGLIEGSYLDYKVDNITFNGFKFKAGN